MDSFVVVLAWQVVDSQAEATLMRLSAASQHVGYTATGSQLRRFHLLTVYLFQRNISHGYNRVRTR